MKGKISYLVVIILIFVGCASENSGNLKKENNKTLGVTAKFIEVIEEDEGYVFSVEIKNDTESSVLIFNGLYGDGKNSSYKVLLENNSLHVLMNGLNPSCIKYEIAPMGYFSIILKHSSKKLSFFIKRKMNIQSGGKYIYCYWDENSKKAGIFNSIQFIFGIYTINNPLDCEKTKDSLCTFRINELASKTKTLDNNIIVNIPLSNDQIIEYEIVNPNLLNQ